MTQNNTPTLQNSKHANKILGFYGTDYETVIQTDTGYYLVQSPDMQLDYDFLGSGLPEGFEPLNRDLCWDILIPNEIFE